MTRAPLIVVALALLALLLPAYAGYGAGCGDEYLRDADVAAQNLMAGRLGAAANLWQQSGDRTKVELAGFEFYRYVFVRPQHPTFCAFVNYERPGIIRPCGAQ